MSAPVRHAPVLARLAGLPCEVMTGFSSDLGGRLDTLAELEAALRTVRAELVDRLFEKIHGAAADKRHALLAVKRDCFNGRPLTPHRHTESWRHVEEACGALAARVLDMEDQAEVARREFMAAYQEETRRQYQRLAALVDDPALRCGLAVASPVVAREAARLNANPPERYGRRERRLASTLLRYISRATLKTSPFSTFTSVGLARLEDGAGPLALAPDGWTLRSLVRLRRHILDRCSDLLLRYPPWREALTVSLNDTALPLEDGRVLYRRPSHYRFEESEQKLKYHEESLVRVRLRGPLVEAVSRLLAAGPLPYRRFVALLAAELGGGVSESGAAAQAEQLIDIGFIALTPPWSSDDRHLESAMLAELRRLPQDAALDSLLAHLEKLVGLEDNFLDARDPAAAFEEMGRLIGDLLQSAAELAGLPPGADVASWVSEHDIYQDVWCAPRSGDTVARAGRAPLEEALRSVAPLVRYARLCDHRIDFLYSLGALLRERRGEHCQIRLLEAFEIARDLWKSFIKSQVQTQGAGAPWSHTWNPLGLPLLDDLALWRNAAHDGIAACAADGPDGRRISVEAFEALLAPIPKAFTESYGGACLFLQPASADGSLWMLNRIKEGTGRFASRYTPVMPAGVREHYANDLSVRGTVEIGGEPAQFLDVHCVQGDTLNVHSPQTPKILTFPGVRVNVPAERQRSLGDLMVTVDGEGWPQLRDGQGQRYLPVYLGVGYHDYLATLIKFICAFGPSEMGAVFPAQLEREANGAAVQERTVIGNVVLHRKSWRVSAEELRATLEGSDEPEVFAALYRWRRARGIPGQLFIIERVPHPLTHLYTRYQPQYVDLTSPLFVPLLRLIAASSEGSVLLVETLPSSEMFPRDGEGRAWATELLLDSLALRPIARNSTPPNREADAVVHGAGPPTALRLGGTPD